jgi:D-glycero-D-manno-heptose 1,7-bisphosphate phosphatase
VDKHTAVMSAKLVENFTDPRLGSDLLWRDLRVDRFSHPRPTLFLDRDGVIVDEKTYLSDPSQVELLPGIPEVICAARTLGMAVVEITNQAGIAHGYFGWHEFVQVENRITQVLAAAGASIDAIFACPFHPQGIDLYRAPNHPWRKPNPGMLLEAAAMLNLALSHSVLVGDKAVDINAAHTAKLAFGVHVLTGHGRAEEAASCAVAAPDFPVHVVEHADEARRFLMDMVCTENGY